MGEYLSRQGFSVLGIRLTGHATRPQDMIRSRYTDWMASVEDGYHLLSGAAEHIYLVGLSMGGILSLLMASKLRVRGVIAMSTPFEMPIDPPIPAPIIRLASHFYPFMNKSADPAEGWHDLDAFEQHVAYPQNPVRSGVELKLLMAEMRAALPKLRVPVLLMHSRDDDYVLEGTMERIYENLGTSEKEMVWVQDSGHVITEEPQREIVFKNAADFIRRVENKYSSKRTKGKR